MEPGQPKYGKKMWARKLREWENRCAKCGKRFPSSELTQGHLLPRSRGGKRSYGNLVPLCSKCNGKDGNILAAYERTDMTTMERFGPDAEASHLLTGHSVMSGEPIHGQMAYVNIPLNKRVEIIGEIAGVTLTNRYGYVHSADLGTDRYRIVLDDPVIFENGISREVEFMEVGLAALRFV